MEVTLAKVSTDQKMILERLLQLCIHDYSEFETIHIGLDGRFHYRWLEYYFTESTRHPFFIYVDDQLAGFVLIREGGGKEQWEYQIAEFFILRTFRGRGVGKTAALKAMGLFSGSWQISFDCNNMPAVSLWNAVADCFDQTILKADPEEENRSFYLIETQAT